MIIPITPNPYRVYPMAEKARPLLSRQQEIPSFRNITWSWCSSFSHCDLAAVYISVQSRTGNKRPSTDPGLLISLDSCEVPLSYTSGDSLDPFSISLQCITCPCITASRSIGVGSPRSRIKAHQAPSKDSNRIARKTPGKLRRKKKEAHQIRGDDFSKGGVLLSRENVVSEENKNSAKYFVFILDTLTFGFSFLLYHESPFTNSLV